MAEGLLPGTAKIKGVGETLVVSGGVVTSDERQGSSCNPPELWRRGEHGRPWASLRTSPEGHPLPLAGESNQHQELLQGSSGPDIWAQRSCYQTRGIATGPRRRILKMDISVCCHLPVGGRGYALWVDTRALGRCRFQMPLQDCDLQVNLDALHSG